jgi:hypothetical protein
MSDEKTGTDRFVKGGKAIYGKAKGIAVFGFGVRRRLLGRVRGEAWA